MHEEQMKKKNTKEDIEKRFIEMNMRNRSTHNYGHFWVAEL